MSPDLLEHPQSLSRTETCCRSCGGNSLQTILDLGITPLADRLVRSGAEQQPELTFPLVVAFCADCKLVQILETVAPTILFADEYPYYSSFSPALVEHFRRSVMARIAERQLDERSLVVELASNDGSLLRHYVSRGIPVLGIDPAEGPAMAAEAVGVPTLCEFFTADFAQEFAERHGHADVVHANNVLAHVADTNGFVKGIGNILKQDGVAVIEAPYLRDLIEHVEFDTIYHEHLCYFSLHALDKLFVRHGLYVNRVERLSIHGGSLRIFVQSFEDRDFSVEQMLTDEMEIGLDRADFFATFSSRVEALRDRLLALIGELKAEGKSIAAYGAAAKGATLLNYCGLDAQRIDFVVDRNVNKHGSSMPGAKVPILGADALMEKQPDYVLMLAWNFADEILAQQAAYINHGGRFIIPVPDPAIVG